MEMLSELATPILLRISCSIRVSSIGELLKGRGREWRELSQKSLAMRQMVGRQRVSRKRAKAMSGRLRSPS